MMTGASHIGGHFLRLCICGAVVEQCKCPGPKPERLPKQGGCGMCSGTGAAAERERMEARLRAQATAGGDFDESAERSEILRDLAEADPIYRVIGTEAVPEYRCALCPGSSWQAARLVHGPKCPWARAVALGNRHRSTARDA